MRAARRCSADQPQRGDRGGTRSCTSASPGPKCVIPTKRSADRGRAAPDRVNAFGDKGVAGWSVGRTLGLPRTMRGRLDAGRSGSGHLRATGNCFRLIVRSSGFAVESISAPLVVCDASETPAPRCSASPDRAVVPIRVPAVTSRLARCRVPARQDCDGLGVEELPSPQREFTVAYDVGVCRRR